MLTQSESGDLHTSERTFLAKDKQRGSGCIDDLDAFNLYALAIVLTRLSDQTRAKGPNSFCGPFQMQTASINSQVATIKF